MRDLTPAEPEIIDAEFSVVTPKRKRRWGWWLLGAYYCAFWIWFATGAWR